MLTSERPPRIFLSSSSSSASTTTTTTTASLSSHHQNQNHHNHNSSQRNNHHHLQQQQYHQQNNQMRRSSSKSVKEYSFTTNGSSNNTPSSNTTTSSSSTTQQSSAPIGCPRERKNEYQNYQLSSSLSHCQQRDNYSSNSNHLYRHSIKECNDNRGKNRKVESGGWHTSSCKLPSTRQILSETTEIEVPTICVTSDNRRTSISSNLRFTRTFSTDSVDSLERQCMKEVRRQRIMDEIELKDTKMLPPASLLSPSNSGFPSLRDVGRSKTDPGGGVESEGATPTAPPKVISGYSFDNTKLSAQLSDIAFKRSNPDLSIDGIKQRTLRDVIGITVYQARLLSQCWPNIYSTGQSGPFASQLYSNLGKRNPKAKTILTKADGVAVFSQSDTDCTSMHTKLTLELIDAIIRTLDNSPTSIINYLTEIGQCHRTLKDEGMSTAMWDDLGDAILEGVRKNDLVRRHKELRRAWLAIIAFITDNIKQGHNTFKASPSTNDINDRNNKEQN